MAFYEWFRPSQSSEKIQWEHHIYFMHDFVPFSLHFDRVKLLNYFKYYLDVTYHLYCCSLAFLLKWMWKILSYLAVLESYLLSILVMFSICIMVNIKMTYNSITNKQQGWMCLQCTRKTAYLFYCLKMNLGALMYSKIWT